MSGWKEPTGPAHPGPPQTGDAGTTPPEGLSPEEDDFYSVAQAAHLLGLSSRRVRQLIEEGKLEADRTPLGAFRLPGRQLREERDRRSGAVSSPAADHADSSPRSEGPAPDSEAARSRRIQPALALAAAGMILITGFVLGWSLRDPIGGGKETTKSGPAVPAADLASSGSRRIVMLIDPPPLVGVRNREGDVVDGFVPSDLTVRQGAPVSLTVFNYDDTPHTFTAPGLGLDQLIAPGSPRGPSSVTLTFTPKQAGSFTWRCRVPCDPWSMGRVGYMRGTVRVVAA